MNEWMNAPGGRDMRSGLPVTRSDGNWKAVDRVRILTVHSLLWRLLKLIKILHCALLNSNCRFKKKTYSSKRGDALSDLCFVLQLSLSIYDH